MGNSHKPYGPYEKYFKRMLDVACALLAMAVFFPVLAVVALLVRIKLGKPILFRQQRPGKEEKIFCLYKFRSMTEKKDDQGNLLPENLRFTDFGNWLRALSLDELPELFNVLKGDMSFVGPRPLLVQYLPLYNEQQRRRHEVRPGITGYAQTHGRNAITWEERFQLDVEYVDHITFLGDLKIILLTIAVVLKKEGVNSETKVTMKRFTGAGEIRK